MSIQSEINRLKTAKTNLASAIESKGVDVSSTATLSDYPALVSAISVGSQNNPDWNQNDNTKDDYIKNRTHWKEVGTGGDEVVYFQNTSLAVDSEGLYGDSTPISVEVGNSVSVDWDNTTYICEAKSVNMEGTSLLALGNVSLFEESYSGTEPFLIIANYDLSREDMLSGKTIVSMDSQVGTHSVKIYKAGDVTYHKLSNKYLNIDETPTKNSENLITSGAVYNVAVQNSSKGTFLVKLSYSSGYVADKTFEEMSEAIDLGYNVVVELFGNSFVYVAYYDSNSMEFTTIYAKSQVYLECTSANVWTISQSGTFFETKNIANNLTTNDSSKALSAAQGVALKSLIDKITVPTKTSQLTNDSGFLTSIPSEYITETELNAKNIVVGSDKSYTIAVSTTEPTTNNTNVITFVI